MKYPGVLLPALAALAAAQSNYTLDCHQRAPETVADDTCEALIAEYNLSLYEFYAMNPSVGPDCMGFAEGEEYCVHGTVVVVDNSTTVTLKPTAPMSMPHVTAVTMEMSDTTQTLTITHPISNGTAPATTTGEHSHAESTGAAETDEASASHSHAETSAPASTTAPGDSGVGRTAASVAAAFGVALLCVSFSAL